MNTYRLRRLVGNILFYLLLGIFVIVIILPIYYIFLTAFTSGDKLFTKPLSYLPQTFAIDRFRAVFAGLPILRYMFNTVFLASVSTVLAIAVSLLAAYALARLQFPGANAILVGLLASSMLPGSATVIPLFQMYQRLQLMDTLHGLLLLYGSGLLPVTVWVLVSFLRQVPIEIEDAAKVDGAGFFAMMWNIILPVIRPGLATMFLINFIAGWNEFFIPLVFARGPAAKVITMALSEAQMIGSSSQFHADWGNMAAVAILATIPVFIITFLFQRQIVEGITNGVFK
ncbi:MAG: carbohydrate ABC transporter permease [Chloroflexi bacterium]|nr:carbohydrate ABC transporter permease [Chloroflexota bacterium]